MSSKAEGAIFPKGLAPFRALGLTLMVMCFLASLALGGLLLAKRATAAWIDNVAGEVTILLRPLEGVDMETELSKAASLAKATRGINRVTVLDKAAAAKLLEPWLGKDVATGVPLPRLITLQVDDKAKPDFAGLERGLAQGVKGATLDTHQRWQAEFSSLGRGMILLASAILALIVTASIALVAYAARSVMEANKAVVDVLQMVGAEPAFIARANDRQFFTIGLLAGGIGLGLALISFLALGFWSTAGETGFAAAGSSLLFDRTYVFNTLALMLLVPLLATLIAVWTARFTLLRALGR